MARNVDIVKTERLYLRGIDESDTEMIIRWRSDPEVYKYFKSPHKITREEHLAWFNTSYKSNENRCDWMCIENDTGDRIGVFGLAREEGSAEINYMLAPEAQHKGYATEAIKGLMDYSKTTWSVGKITAEVHRDNMASVALVERLGFSIYSTSKDFYIYSLELKD